MKRVSRYVAALAFASVATVYADTVKTIDNNSANGRVIKLDETTLVMKAQFVGDERDITIARSQIKSIEFNGNFFNSNAPRGAFFARSPQLNPTKKDDRGTSESSPSGPQDTLFLKTGGQRDAYIIGVDEKSIHLMGGQLVDRYLAQSIRFAAR